MVNVLVHNGTLCYLIGCGWHQDSQSGVGSRRVHAKRPADLPLNEQVGTGEDERDEETY